MKYRAFVEAVRCGCLTDAAEILNYTQPGISHMINSLEQSIGVPLLIRSKQGVTPTENGKRIYDILKQIVSLEDTLSSTVDQMNGALIGTLRIGSFFSILTKWMPNVVEQFSQKFPQVELQMFEGEVDEQLTLLENNRIDVGIFSGPTPKDYLFIPLHVDPAVAILPEGHPLASREMLAAEDLLHYPLLRQHETSAEELFRIFSSGPFPPASAYTIKSDSAIIALVQKGLGIGVTSELLACPPQPGVIVRHFERPYPRTIGLAVPLQNASLPVLKCFIEVVCRLYQDPEFA